MKTLLATLLAAIALALPPRAAAQTRGVTAEDYFAFETLGDPRFSPDGSTIAYVVTTIDQKQNRRRSTIYSVPADGSREPQALTDPVRSSTSPRWRPDGGAIAFLSARPAPGDDNPRTQVWLLPLGGGEPRRLTSLANGVTSFQWSPDGASLVVVSRSGPSDTAKSPSDVRHYRHANWIVSHTTRFKAAVTLRSISNFISDDGTRDGQYGHADDFTGDIFEKFDLYWSASPLKYVKSVKTPTLVLHSDNDFRVPIEQGEQWFRALQHVGVPSEIVFFPRENHNLTRTGEPKHLVESINWQVYWFERYIDGNARAAPPDAPSRAASSTSQDR